MRYLSTRGLAAQSSFTDVLLAGLAPDGGLFLPEAWPALAPAEIAAFRGVPYVEAASRILPLFWDEKAGKTKNNYLAEIGQAYEKFDDPAVAPLVEIGPGLYLLELFHGPTLAFKDFAMQVLGRLFARALAERGGRATVLAATSGDTGSAAIAALGGLPNIEVFVLHPKGRVSEVQRKQMTATPYANVHNIALEGTFDDAQSIVKALFGEKDFADRVNLAAVNSINFARIAAQTVYYFTAAAALGAPPVFVVPTGNFGDVFAGEAAARMGLAIEKLVVATNSNDILARALTGGVYETGRVEPTLSPSMDIQVASNFERALFEASGRDADWTAHAMKSFGETRKLVLPAPVRAALAERYAAHRANDEETLAAIARVHAETGRLIDPHTGVGVAAARALRDRFRGPAVVLSTAHPAKFPEAVRRATGEIPPAPPRLREMMAAPEKMDVLAADKGLVRATIEARVKPL